MNLEIYFAQLILRELEQFRDSAIMPATEDTATKVAQHVPPTPSATAQISTPAQTTDTDSATDGEDDNQLAPAQQPQDITALLDADEATNGFQGSPVRRITLHNDTVRQRRANGERQQRIYRLAQKIGVLPGGARWVRKGKPYMQPAVPRSVVRADNMIEYNQFVYDDKTGKVVLRMPGGWKRDLVRNRREFRGVAVVDGYLWPRFDRRLPRRMTVDWGKLIPSSLLCCLSAADIQSFQRSRASSSSMRFDTRLDSSRASPRLSPQRDPTRRTAF